MDKLEESTEEESKNISVDSMFLNLMFGCGTGVLCSNKLVSGFKSYSILASTRYVFKVDRHEYLAPLEKTAAYDGVCSLKDSYFNMYRPSVLSNLLDVHSLYSNLSLTLGSYYHGVSYPGRFTMGLFNVGGVVSCTGNFSLLLPDTVLSTVNSDFWIVVSVTFEERVLLGVASPEGRFTINRGTTRLEEVYNRVESIWLKMFFPVFSGKSFIEKTIMQMHVTERAFYKRMHLKYYYVDEYIVQSGNFSKEGDRDIKEKKHKDVDDPFRDKKIEKMEDLICGPNRTMTYLSYQGFDHVLNYEGSDRLWGNITPRIKEIINSPYLKIVENKVLLPGMKISDIQKFSKSLSESMLSHIESLPDVYNWKIEDFTLEKKDFDGYLSNTEDLSIIMESYRKSVKFVTDTLGDDVAAYEAEVSKDNMFRDFPDRRVDDGYLKKYQAHQYITSFEKNNV